MYFFPGSGWLTLIFDHAVAKHQYNTDKKCDPWYKANPYCETYIKVMFDNRQAFKSATKDYVLAEVPNYYFYELFRSHKIPKSTDIKIETWDEDDGHNDDLILQADTNPTSLGNGAHKYTSGENKLSVVSYWRTEYEDD